MPTNRSVKIQQTPTTNAISITLCFQLPNEVVRKVSVKLKNEKESNTKHASICNVCDFCHWNLACHCDFDQIFVNIATAFTEPFNQRRSLNFFHEMLRLTIRMIGLTLWGSAVVLLYQSHRNHLKSIQSILICRFCFLSFFHGREVTCRMQRAR